jgi:hypothetical protein
MKKKINPFNLNTFMLKSDVWVKYIYLLKILPSMCVVSSNCIKAFKEIRSREMIYVRYMQNISEKEGKKKTKTLSNITEPTNIPFNDDVQH